MEVFPRVRLYVLFCLRIRFDRYMIRSEKRVRISIQNRIRARTYGNTLCYYNHRDF